MNFLRMLPLPVKQRLRKIVHQTLPHLPLGKEFQISHLAYKVFVDTNDHCGREIFIKYLLLRRWAHEQYEQAVVKNLIQRLGTCWVVDVGASYGMYSLLAAKLKERELVGKIFAIEASPKTCIWLNKTILANNLENSIQVMNVAAAELDGKDLSFLAHPDHSEWSRLAPGRPDGTQQSTTVKSITLDRLLANSGWDSSIPLLVKMDIEGGEPDAVAGIRQTLSKAKNYFAIVEFHVALLDQSPDGAMKFARDLLALNTPFLYELNESKECLVRIRDEESFQALVIRCRAGKQLSEIMTNIVFGTQEISDLAMATRE